MFSGIDEEATERKGRLGSRDRVDRNDCRRLARIARSAAQGVDEQSTIDADRNVVGLEEVAT